MSDIEEALEALERLMDDAVRVEPPIRKHVPGDMTTVLAALKQRRKELQTNPKPLRIPDGYRLVPIEPTETMLKSAEREWDGRMSARSAGVWDVMLAAAPSPDSGDESLQIPNGAKFRDTFGGE